MRKKIIPLLILDLIATSLWIYLLFTASQLLILYHPLFWGIVLLSIIGFIIGIKTLKVWGGIKSFFGRGLFYLSITFFFNIVQTVSSYFQGTYSNNSLSYITIISAFIIYCSWALSLFFFLKATGNTIAQKIRLDYIIAVAIIVSSVSVLALNLTKVTTMIDLKIIYLIADLIILGETIILIANIKSFQGASLFYPSLMLCLGIFAQLLGDFFYPSTPLFSINTINLVPLIYMNSWLLLALAPSTFPTDE